MSENNEIQKANAVIINKSKYRLGKNPHYSRREIVTAISIYYGITLGSFGMFSGLEYTVIVVLLK